MTNGVVMNLKEALLKNINCALWVNTTDFKQEYILDKIAYELNNGCKMIQFYFTDISDIENIEIGLKLRQLCSMYNALLIVNSRIDIAQVIEADGICLFKNNLTPNHIQKIIHNDIILSFKVETVEDVIYANQNNLDYICVDSNKLPLINDDLAALNKIKFIELNRKFL